MDMEELLNVAADRIEELERLLKEEKEKEPCDNLDDGDPWNE